MLYILSQSKNKGFTKWAETDSAEKLYEFVKYFAENCYCEDLILYYENKDFPERNSVMMLTEYCKQRGIPIIYHREEATKKGPV